MTVLEKAKHLSTTGSCMGNQGFDCESDLPGCNCPLFGVLHCLEFGKITGRAKEAVERFLEAVGNGPTS